MKFFTEHWINLIDIMLLGLVLFLQIKNYIKYRDTNGHLRKRIVMVLSVSFLIIHVVRLMFDITAGAFLFLHVVTWLMIYDVIDYMAAWRWLKGLFRRG
jgi:hypothetical protein